MALFGLRGGTPAPKVTVVTTMKNEGAYILDWVSHYKTLGATDIVVFTNDCNDPTDHVLRCLNRQGVIHHRFSRVMRRGPHKSALMWAEYEPAVREAEWLLVVDVDEYLQINVGEGRFEDLIKAHPGVDAISLVWRIFGNGGVQEIADEPVPCEFTLAEARAGGEGEYRFFKTLYRNDTTRFARMGVHRPFLAEEHAPIKWVLPGGKLFTPEQVVKGLNVTGEFGYDTAQLNHYALRSVDGFLNKQNRGRANHVNGSIDLKYWNRFDRNVETDATLAENFGRAETYRENLLARDEMLRQFHENAFAWHRKMARKAKRQPEVKEFLKAIRPGDGEAEAA